MNIKYKIIIANIVLILAIFPYISILNLPFEIQPWALVLASIFSLNIIYEDKFKFPTALKIIMFFDFYVFLSFFYLVLKGDADFILGIRSLSGYLSIFVFSLVSYKSFIYIKSKYYIGSIGVWLAVAFSQIIFGAAWVAPLLTRFSSGGSRGLTSIAPEPSFYAAICISLLILNEFFYLDKKYKTNLYVGVFLILLLQIILSYSGVGMMLLILFASSKLFELIFIKEDKKRKLLALGAIFLIAISVLLFFNNKLLGDKRAGSVLKQSITDPIALVKTDYSVSNRLMNPVIGIYGGIIETKGLGFGVGSKEKGPAPEWLSKLKGIQMRFGGKIEGGLVSAIYDLGFIGVIFIFTVFWIVGMSILRNKKMRPALIASAMSLFIPMFIWGSLSFPLFGYILGIHLYCLCNKD